MKKLVFKISLLAITALSVMSCKKEGKKEDAATGTATATTTEKLKLEKPQVTLGFIKLTDMAPLAIAKEKGFFEDEGLFVTLEAQSNWKNVLDRVIDEQIDGSHMLAGQPIAAAVGFGRQAKLVTTFSMDLNGNAITVSNDVWSKMKPSLPLKDGKPVHPISASALVPVIKEYKNANKPFKMGMVFPVSTHNYQLRYWLAAGGINPGMYTKDNVQGMINAEALLSVTPPPQMPATLEAGTINGYCVGEPWNQQAVSKGIGVPVITSRDIWKNHPEKVFVMTKAFVEKNPNTAIAITKALIRAGKWLDDPKNRDEAVKILSSPAYVGADEAVLKNSMTGTFEYEKGDKRDAADFNVFFKYNATYPFYSDGVWYMTQMRRWGQITEAQPADWYASKIKEVYMPEIWKKAAEMLVKEGNLSQEDIPTTDGYKEPTSDFIDGIQYDGKKPLEYIKSMKIGNKN
ncbi:nitrate ABC transporter substrate-binding protein [Flavobacterium faecale]|uniref:Nitrate ABC transporter substrate-binding protein n=1 Tax=Flavobacterium faecale TaxID=1355330 RepID=A0A2S1LEB1_9FLAO|nr:CmpA/NrtA family ABC transporter substrate-binding protein [Flavobacterium faecale]AWG21886.1 nitrate ABC transporter substrate-binding protein [Flavobacterium faecale]